jgi:hypothetical protein
MTKSKIYRGAIPIASLILTLMFAQSAMSEQAKRPATANVFDTCMSTASALNSERTLEVDGCLQAHNQSCNVKSVASTNIGINKVKLTASLD